MGVDTSMKVLVVDDFATMRRIVKGVLKQLGFNTIVEAEDGSGRPRGLEKRKDRIDRLGLEHAEDDRAGSSQGRQGGATISSRPPFIMVTAEGQKENVIEAVKAGVSNYIVKPFTIRRPSAKSWRRSSPSGCSNGPSSGSLRDRPAAERRAPDEALYAPERYRTTMNEVPSPAGGDDKMSDRIEEIGTRLEGIALDVVTLESGDIPALGKIMNALEGLERDSAGLDDARFSEGRAGDQGARGAVDPGRYRGSGSPGGRHQCTSGISEGHYQGEEPREEILRAFRIAEPSGSGKAEPEEAPGAAAEDLADAPSEVPEEIPEPEEPPRSGRLGERSS